MKKLKIESSIIGNSNMRTILNLILLTLLVLTIPFHELGCVQQSCPTVPMVVPPPPPVPAREVHPKVVLITLDGVRWQDVFNGTDLFLYRGEKLSARELLPNLYYHFVDRGMVVGKDSKFVATGPAHISLPGYLEIMRGHPSTDCQENDCEPRLKEETIADVFNKPAVFASWDTIRKTVGTNTDRYVVNCGRHFRTKGWKQAELEDNQSFPEAWDPIYRPDDLTEKAAIDYLQYYSPDFVWISLGDTDEWAHYGDYNKYIESLQQADKFVGMVLEMVKSGEDGSDFTFIVTADHGRGLDWRHHGWDNESARDWLMMSGRGIPAQGFVKYPEKKSLSNILPTIKELTTGVHTKNSLL
jgi:hypothetical protein